MSQFMVEFDLPVPFPEEFIVKIPQQRLAINTLLEAGKIHSYSLSMERNRLWCIVNAETEFEVMDIIHDFPLIDYMKYTINELMFHNSVMMRVPSFSLN
jgi:Muconolactone delta-isomerase